MKMFVSFAIYLMTHHVRAKKKWSEETKQSIRSVDAQFIDVLSELICVLYNFYCRIAVMAFVGRFNFQMTASDCHSFIQFRPRCVCISIKRNSILSLLLSWPTAHYSRYVRLLISHHIRWDETYQIVGRARSTEKSIIINFITSTERCRFSSPPLPFSLSALFCRARIHNLFLSHGQTNKHKTRTWFTSLGVLWSDFFVSFVRFNSFTLILCCRDKVIDDRQMVCARVSVWRDIVCQQK